LAPDVDLHAIAHNPHATGFSGADCAALLREAGLAVLRDGVLRRTTNPTMNNNNGEADSTPTKPAPLQITAIHFQYAFEHVIPSVSKKDQARYDKLRDRMARARTRGGVVESTKSASSTGEDGGDIGDTSDVEK
jgi:ribosome biogenesis ATPase